jgi:hypothetical protein
VLSFALFGQLTGLVFDRTGSLSTTVWSVAAAVLALGLVWTWLARRLPTPARDLPCGRRRWTPRADPAEDGLCGL